MNKCYREFLGNRIFTPADRIELTTIYGRITRLKFNGEKCLADPVELREATLLDKVRLIPAISCAILARLVRAIKDEKGTEMERDLMRYYYEREVKIRGI